MIDWDREKALKNFTAVPLTFLSSRPEGEILFYSGLRSLTFVRDDNIGIFSIHVSTDWEG